MTIALLVKWSLLARMRGVVRYGPRHDPAGQRDATRYVDVLRMTAARAGAVPGYGDPRCRSRA
jgi:hypothetical protein